MAANVGTSALAVAAEPGDHDVTAAAKPGGQVLSPLWIGQTHLCGCRLADAAPKSTAIVSALCILNLSSPNGQAASYQRIKIRSQALLATD